MIHYKNRETFTFRGLTYRYNKMFGEWRLVDKKTRVDVPRAVLSHYRGGWEVEFKIADTPQAALAKWLDSQIGLCTEEISTRREQLAAAREELKRLKQKDLRV